MHNGLLPDLRGYVEALFKDMAFMYRQPKGMVRDKARLLHELEVHGLRVVTIDLPALAKHLDKCLVKGKYTPSNSFLGGLGRAGVPAFLQDLYLLVFSPGGCLRDDALPEAVAGLRQLLSSLKKLRVQYQWGGLVDEIDNFIEVERDCRSPSLKWDGDCRHAMDPIGLSFADWVGTDPTVSAADAKLLQSVCDRIVADLGLFDPHSIADESLSHRTRHGPGVVADLGKSENKYAFKDWPDKLDSVFPYDLFASRNLGCDRLDADGQLPYRNREVPARMIAVPKEHSKPRLIAAEPSCHQWIQQAVWNCLEERISHTVLRGVVDFRDQTLNQRRAMSGSIDGSLATIDLSSASDRLSCAAVERFTRKNVSLLHCLWAARTRWLRIDIKGLSVQHFRLKKFAPMGAAVTFPVQSVFYACVAIASVLLSKGMPVTTTNIRKAAKQVSVFGDDIVVPTTCCRDLLRMLAFVGMKVNLGKTCLEGNFRESCGVEAFRGIDVTPARVLEIPKRNSSTGPIGSYIEQANNLFKRGWWRASEWMLQHIQEHLSYVPVIPVDSGAMGVVSFCGSYSDHLKKRWNDETQQEEWRVITARTRQSCTPADGDLSLFQYFTERPPADSLNWQAGVKGRPVSSTRPGWRTPWSIGLKSPQGVNRE